MRTEKTDTSRDIRGDARFKLFVEGADEKSFDKAVLSELLDRDITVESLGSCFRIESAAAAFSPIHQNYFYIVDRDDKDDEIVEASWINFPDPSKSNLLYWRRKEIENYFLIPEFICSSEFFKGKKEDFISKLQTEATKRVFLDAANLVISGLRDQLKANWIRYFRTPDNFRTREAALEQLLQCPEFSEKIEQTDSLLETGYIKELFQNRCDEMIGDKASCVCGSGKWEYLMSGKELLHNLVNTNLFAVPDGEGNLLTGKLRLREIAERLVREKKNFPDDFLQLKELILTKITSRT